MWMWERGQALRGAFVGRGVPWHTRADIQLDVRKRISQGLYACESETRGQVPLSNFVSTDSTNGSTQRADIQMSDWAPTGDQDCLARNMSYIKPLNGSFGPRSTKCEIHDEMVHSDFDDYISMDTTMRAPDVPSGGVFSVKTRTCVTWVSSASARIVVTTQVGWTGRSFVKGATQYPLTCLWFIHPCRFVRISGWCRGPTK